MRCVSRLVLLWVLSISPALAADVTPLSAELQPLDRAVGKWIYHGVDAQTAYTKAGKWTWEVDCGWSANRLYLLCSFTMDWPEGLSHSLSVTTYNEVDKSYWHYEMLDDEPGAKPFVARMSVAGDTWTDASEDTRVTYQYTSSTQARVKIEASKDKVHWITLGQGEGVKQP